MDKWSIRGFALAAVTFSASFGYIAGFSGWPSPDQVGTIGEWFGAAGAFFAAITALLIARWSEDRRRDGERLEGAMEALAATDSIDRLIKLSKAWHGRLAEVAANLDKNETAMFEAIQDTAVRVSDTDSEHTYISDGHEDKMQLFFDRAESLERKWKKLAPPVEKPIAALMDIPHVKIGHFDKAAGRALLEAKVAARNLENLKFAAGAAVAVVNRLADLRRHLEVALPRLQAASAFLDQEG